MPFPRTQDELKAAGYSFWCSRMCRSCHNVRLEFWKTADNKKLIPLEVKPSGEVTPHWGNCPGSAKFRKPKAQDTTQETP